LLPALSRQYSAGTRYTSAAAIAPIPVSNIALFLVGILTAAAATTTTATASIPASEANAAAFHHTVPSHANSFA